MEQEEIWINGVQYEAKRATLSHGCSGCVAYQLLPSGSRYINQQLCGQLPKCVAPNVVFTLKQEK
jgi:hypothetical protein